MWGAHPAVAGLPPVLLLAVDAVVVAPALAAHCRGEKQCQNAQKRAKPAPIHYLHRNAPPHPRTPKSQFGPVKAPIGAGMGKGEGKDPKGPKKGGFCTKNGASLQPCVGERGGNGGETNPK